MDPPAVDPLADHLSLNSLPRFTAVLCLACDPNPSTPPPPEVELDPLVGTGDYEFDGYEPLADKPLRVWYHVPDGLGPEAPIVLVFHGVNRDADAYIETWIPLADEYGFVVAAPEFREVFYPGSSGYALGNVFEDGDEPSVATLNDASVWTFQWLEPLFDDLVARTPSEAVAYQAFGHSAGAQFLQRLVQFVPDGRYEYVIAANAGWYMVPDDVVTFPYGLDLTPLAGGDRSYFGRSLVIHNGALDTDPNSAGLRHTPEADAQGLHRLARGEYYFNQSADLAAAAGEPFAWQREVIPGIGHSQEGMGPAAAEWLAEALANP